jgi:hypothetical protein
MNGEPVQTNQVAKTNGWTRGWHIFRSAWRVLMLDKEVLLVPLLAGIISLVIAIIGYVGGYALGQGTDSSGIINYAAGQTSNNLSYTTYVAWIMTSAVIALIATYTLAAVVSITLERLRGGDPTIRSGLSRVKQRLGSLTVFGILSFGVVQILRLIEDRVPFIGAKILAFLGEVAWGVAAFFAVPVIVDSQKRVGPISATKQSLDIIRRTWREPAGSQFGVGFVILLLVVAELLIGVIGAALAYSVVGASGAVGIGILFGIALLATMLVSTTVAGIAKAALYYYAVTGEAPEQFNKELMHQAFTPKKARKLFGF